MFVEVSLWWMGDVQEWIQSEPREFYRLAVRPSFDWIRAFSNISGLYHFLHASPYSPWCKSFVLYSVFPLTFNVWTRKWERLWSCVDVRVFTTESYKNLLWVREKSGLQLHLPPITATCLLPVAAKNKLSAHLTENPQSSFYQEVPAVWFIRLRLTTIIVLATCHRLAD